MTGSLLVYSLAQAKRLWQSIAVTGAVNQHGEVLPVGGLNEKIEGWFRVCEHAGLDGSHAVLIPERNRRHLMLDRDVVDAVAAGLFQVHAVTHVSEGIELLTGQSADPGAPDGVLLRAEQTLRAYRRACRRFARR